MRTRLCLAKAVVLLTCKKTAPLDQNSGAALLEMGAAYVATILIEVVKYQGTYQWQSLQNKPITGQGWWFERPRVY